MNYIEWIEPYLDGALDPENRILFEAQLKQSPELETELALAQAIQHAVHHGAPDPAHEHLIATLHGSLQAAHLALIEKYHSGQADADERVRFREMLDDDELFAFEVKLYREKHDIRSKTHAISGVIRWAAAVFVLALASWWIWSLQTPDLVHLAVLYDKAELYPSTEIALDDGLLHKSIVGPGGFSALKKEGLRAYEERRWNDAIRQLDAYIAQTRPSEDETPDEINIAYLFIGRAWMEKGDFIKAAEALQKGEAGVTDEVNYGMIRELIRWHLALAYLRNGDKRAATDILEALGQADHADIRNQAGMLLKALKN